MGRVDQSTADAHCCDGYVANRSNGTANPAACDPQIEIALVPHGGSSYEAFVAALGFTFGGGGPQSLLVDLDIDSDNNNGTQPPDRSAQEDALEDDFTAPGKIIAVNDGDSDADGVPGFADGFGRSGTPTSDDLFVPLVLQIPSDLSLNDCRILIGYSGSDPASVWQETDSHGNLFWKPLPGNLRIWKKNGNQLRNARSALLSANPGDYVAPGMYSDVTKLGFSTDLRAVTFYVEGIAPSTNPADLQIRAVLYAYGDPPRSVGSDAVRLTVIKVHLDVDTDRDGVVSEQADQKGKETWAHDRGAIFGVNFDRNGNRLDGAGMPIPDAINFSDDGMPTDEDYTIENADDALDIAPMVIRSIGTVPTGVKVLLEAESQQDIQRVHIYKKIAAGEAAIWGGATGPTPPTELDITKWVDASSPDFQGDPSTRDTTFGIEGMFFRYQGPDVPQLLEFDGEIGFTLEIRLGTTVLASDKVHLKVAPWIACTHIESSQQVWAASYAGQNDEFLYSSSAGPGYKGLDDSQQLKTATQPDVGTQWLQDHVQFGFTQRPGGPKKHIAFRLPYYGGPALPQPTWPLTRLLGPGVGAFQFGRYLGAALPSGDFGGNLEVFPPTTAHPLGQVCMGDICSGRLRQFLLSQEVQPAFFDLPTAWLMVGHIDEISSFSDADTVVIADPVLGWNLIADTENIPAAKRHCALFFATGTPPEGGTVGSTTATRLYDGPATGRIVTVNKGSLADGETFTIKQGASTSKTFEFNLTGGVAAGRLPIDLTATGDISADQVRDLIIVAINNSGLSVNAVADGPSAVHLWNTTKGIAGNEAITKTVVSPGFTVSGMSGGKDDGRDFTAQTWGFVRTFTYDTGGKPSSGQVARIKVEGLHDGWIQIDRVLPTTSKMIDGTAPAYDLGYWADPGHQLPTLGDWSSVRPTPGDKYALCEGTRRWWSGGVSEEFRTPAVVSVEEVLSDSDFQALNNADIPAEIATFRANLSAHGTGSLSFVGVPALFFGTHGHFNQPGFRGGVAFNPGPTNLQPLNGKRYVPRQYGPRTTSGVDVFENGIRTALGGGATEFIDCWDVYHRLSGEVHCGSEVSREFPAADWWTVVP